jgi:hypothetical protein
MLESCLSSLGVYGEAKKAIIAIVNATAKPAIKAFDTDAEKLGLIAEDFLRKSLGRKQFIGNIADDPAWNIMLAIFAAQTSGHGISIAGVTATSEVAGTTALRYLTHLADRGILERSSDPHDMRRTFVELSPTAYDRMIETVRSFCVSPPTPSTVDS